MDKSGKGTTLAGMGGGKTPDSFSLIGDALEKGRQDLREDEDDGSGDREIEDHGEDRGSQLESVTAKFTEKKIRNMIRAPFELAFLKTGCEGVRIKDAEIDLILEDTVDILNALVKINPLWLAVGSVIVNGGMITMSKIDAYAEFKKEKAAAKSAESKQS